MSTTDSPLNRLHRDAEILSGKPDIPPETAREIDAIWKEIDTGLDPRKPENFGMYFQQRLAEVHRETDPRKRSEAICGCGNPLCALLRGEVPNSMGDPTGRPDSSPITPRDAKLWARNHAKPHIVEQVVSEFESEKATTRRQLREIIRLAKQEVGSQANIDESAIPGYDPAEGET